MNTRCPLQPHISGFTLLELLIALSLAAIVSIMVLGSMSFSSGAWQKLNQESEHVRDLQVTQSTLRRIVKSIIPIKLTNSEKIDFRGTADDMEFVVTRLARLDEGGLKRVKLDAKFDTAYKELHLSWQRYQYENNRNSRYETLTLLSGISSLKIRYFGNQSENTKTKKWYSRWEKQKRLPSLIALQIEYPGDDKRVWPELYISLELSEK
ncbi:MAG: prepilin-type N-terminal cleavage/methylation domain-containing protein [Sneathiella sp.]